MCLAHDRIEPVVVGSNPGPSLREKLRDRDYVKFMNNLTENESKIRELSKNAICSKTMFLLVFKSNKTFSTFA